MSRQYSYPPPPPPPPPSAPSPAGSYPPTAYGQNSPYSHASRGGGGMTAGNGAGAGRGRGGHHASAYGSYAQQDYAGHGPAPYANQTPNSYWGSSPPSALPPHGSTPLPQSNYHPNYAPQAYATQPHPAYQPSPYPPNPQQPYPPSYTPSSGEYPPRQWGETGSPYSPYPSRGGRGAFQGDRGGHRSDHGSGPPIRMGFDQNAGHATQASNGYGQTYPPPPQHHASPAYPVPPYPYAPPPMPAPAYSGPAPTSYSSHGHRGRGRDGSGGNFRGRSHHHNDRGGDKFRHRGQRPHQDHNNSTQKSDPSSSKKKKRKTNTLGLTPGDGDESGDESGDEEKRLVDLLGADAPVVPDLAAWIAERRANFPTQARIQAKKAAEEARRAEVGEEPKPATKLDKDEEKAEKLRRQLAKVERKLEKRKREANDEGDEMRVDGADSSASDSDDGKPEAMSTRKPPSFLPPPPITRADPTNHCKYYSTGGICGKKGKCRFVHDNQVREQALREQAANGGRLTLNQRLLRNDKDQEDLAIVQSIVDLRSSGRLARPEKSVNTKAAPPEQRTHPLPAKVEAASLPPAPDVLPDGRVKSAYISPEVQDIFNGLKPMSNKD